MFAVRSAMLILALSLLLLPSPVSASSGGSPGEDGVSALCRLEPAIAGPVFLPIPHSSSLAQFTLWNARPKVVLEDTDQKFGEEADLGPARPPRKLMSRPSVHSRESRRPTTPRLRC
jgi:hypothetical protein